MIFAPQESPDLRSRSMNSSSWGTMSALAAKKGLACTASQLLNGISMGPSCVMQPRTTTPNFRRSHLRAIAAAATRTAVSRADWRPPPR